MISSTDPPDDNNVHISVHDVVDDVSPPHDLDDLPIGGRRRRKYPQVRSSMRIRRRNRKQQEEKWIDPYPIWNITTPLVRIRTLES